jgi:hypothetical protein
MLSLTDCIDLSELSPSEIAAIAEHECLPDIVAAELGCRLLQTPGGRVVLKHYIHENLVHARARHHEAKAQELALLLRQFDRAHPEQQHRAS